MADETRPVSSSLARAHRGNELQFVGMRLWLFEAVTDLLCAWVACTAPVAPADHFTLSLVPPSR